MPWEQVEFPLFMSGIPPSLEGPWHDDQNGAPVVQGMQEIKAEQENYRTTYSIVPLPQLEQKLPVTPAPPHRAAALEPQSTHLHPTLLW